jgi:hypothetical protein
MTKQIDWTKPIRWHGTAEELHHVGVLKNGKHVVCYKESQTISQCYTVDEDGRHDFSGSKMFLENIPETIKRWVIMSIEFNIDLAYQFESEGEANEFYGCDRIIGAYTKPVLVEFQVP